MRPRSLSSRLILSSAVVSIILLAATGIAAGEPVQRGAGTQFRCAAARGARRAARATSKSARRGDPELQSELVDTRFALPLSGWYWQVTPAVQANEVGDLASESLLEQRLAPTREMLAKRGSDGVASFYLTDSNGASLRAIEQVFKLPGSERDFSVLVAGNFDELSDEVECLPAGADRQPRAAGHRPAAGHLRSGALRPEAAATSCRRTCSAIRQGKAEQLEGDYPAEIQPVADELNLLIQSNTEIIERARTQVGNLAHALKTPLSVLTNEAAAQKGPLSQKVIEQAQLMRDQVSLYLDRARRAARAQGVGAVTDVKPVLDALARTLAPHQPGQGCDRRRRLRGGAEVPRREAGPRGNGGQPARQCLQVVEPRGDGEGRADAGPRCGRTHWLTIEVDDDGPGLAGRQARRSPEAWTPP